MQLSKIRPPSHSWPPWFLLQGSSCLCNACLRGHTLRLRMNYQLIPKELRPMARNDHGNKGRSEEDADDVRLMQLIGRGDTIALEQLIGKHQALVAGTVARMLGSNSDVEDIAQQVFIRVWKSARRYVPRAKFTTWLLKITRNLVFNELRRAKRHAHVPFSRKRAQKIRL